MEEDGTTEKIRNTPTAVKCCMQSTDNTSRFHSTETKKENQNDMTWYVQNISTERYDYEDTPLDFSLRNRYREDEASSSESLNSPSSSASHIDNTRSESENSVHSLNWSVKKEHPDKCDLKNGEGKTTLQSSLAGHSDIKLPPDSPKMLYPSLTYLVDSNYINQNARPSSNKHSPNSPSPSGVENYVSRGHISSTEFDSSVHQNLKSSPEEVLTIYRQQLDALKDQDQDKYTSSHSTRPSGTTSLSFVSSPVPSLSPIHDNRTMNNVISNGSSPVCTHSLAATLHHSAGSRKRSRSLPDNKKNEAYWERRRKNNDAAKRSRDASRAKEDEIAIRAAILEQENIKLRVEVTALKNETAKLRCLLYNS